MNIEQALSGLDLHRINHISIFHFLRKVCIMPCLSELSKVLYTIVVGGFAYETLYSSDEDIFYTPDADICIVSGINYIDLITSIISTFFTETLLKWYTHPFDVKDLLAHPELRGNHTKIMINPYVCIAVRYDDDILGKKLIVFVNQAQKGANIVDIRGENTNIWAILECKLIDSYENQPIIINGLNVENQQMMINGFQLSFEHKINKLLQLPFENNPIFYPILCKYQCRLHVLYQRICFLCNDSSLDFFQKWQHGLYQKIPTHVLFYENHMETVHQLSRKNIYEIAYAIQSEQQRIQKEFEMEQERKRIENDRIESERRRVEQERIENERLEQERIYNERQRRIYNERQQERERKRLEKQRIYNERKTRLENEIKEIEKQRIIVERELQKRIEEERLECERQRIEKERIENERKIHEKEKILAEKKQHQQQKKIEKKQREKEKKQKSLQQEKELEELIAKMKPKEEQNQNTHQTHIAPEDEAESLINIMTVISLGGIDLTQNDFHKTVSYMHRKKDILHAYLAKLNYKQKNELVKQLQNVIQMALFAMPVCMSNLQHIEKYLSYNSRPSRHIVLEIITMWWKDFYHTNVFINLMRIISLFGHGMRMEFSEILSKKSDPQWSIAILLFNDLEDMNINSDHLIAWMSAKIKYVFLWVKTKSLKEKNNKDSTFHNLTREFIELKLFDVQNEQENSDVNEMFFQEMMKVCAYQLTYNNMKRHGLVHIMEENMWVETKNGYELNIRLAEPDRVFSNC